MRRRPCDCDFYIASMTVLAAACVLMTVLHWFSRSSWNLALLVVGLVLTAAGRIVAWHDPRAGCVADSGEVEGGSSRAA